MEHFFDSLTTYYGLDWVALATGMLGTWLLGERKRMGFSINALSCLCGFSVALMSDQYGFIVYNAILLALMARGYMQWGAKGTGANLKPAPAIVA